MAHEEAVVAGVAAGIRVDDDVVAGLDAVLGDAALGEPADGAPLDEPLRGLAGLRRNWAAYSLEWRARRREAGTSPVQTPGAV